MDCEICIERRTPKNEQFHLPINLAEFVCNRCNKNICSLHTIKKYRKHWCAECVKDMNFWEMGQKFRKRLEKSIEEHELMTEKISKWFKKRGYDIHWEWNLIDLVAKKLNEKGDDWEEIIGIEVKTSNKEIKKAIEQAKQNKKNFCDQFYIALKKINKKEIEKMPEWLGVMTTNPKIKIIRKAEHIRCSFPPINYWKLKKIVYTFRLPNRSRLTTKAKMREALKIVNKQILSKAMRLVLFDSMQSLLEWDESLRKHKIVYQDIKTIDKFF